MAPSYPGPYRGLGAFLQKGPGDQDPVDWQRIRQKILCQLQAGRQLDSGLEGGINNGKSWMFVDGRLCRDYYRFSEVHCSVFEVAGGALYLLNPSGSKDPVTSVEFAQP